MRIFVREQGSGAVAAAVGSSELDVGIVTLPLSGASEARLRVVPWLQDELVLIVPPTTRSSGDGRFAGGTWTARTWSCSRPGPRSGP